MITEDYVSFETAKLLKEKGFDEPTTKSYYTEGFENPMIFSHDLLPCIRPNEFLCPTLQMAMKWLREVHHLHIIPEISDASRLKPQYYVVIWLTSYKRESYILELFDSYEEACEAAIKYCLEKLI